MLIVVNSYNTSKFMYNPFLTPTKKTVQTTGVALATTLGYKAFKKTSLSSYNVNDGHVSVLKMPLFKFSFDYNFPTEERNIVHRFSDGVIKTLMPIAVGSTVWYMSLRFFNPDYFEHSQKEN